MKIEIKKTILFFLFLSFSTFTFSQEDKAKSKKDFWQRVFVGGNLGLQFGSITAIDISPLAGYQFTDKFAAGVGITYLYYKYNNYSTNVYGGRVFGRYNITNNLMAHAEYEVLNRDHPRIINARLNVTNILVGGGYRQLLGANSYLNILVLWNLNESEYSLYNNPIIRAGVVFGL